MSGLPALIRGLKDKEGLVRGASAWALGKIGGDQANAALESSRDTERDPQVLGEIELALSMLNQ
jgi:epoxyqueuosine reductase